MLEIRAHQTLLGTYEVNDSIKVVCACQDFTADGKRLLDFCDRVQIILTATHIDEELIRGREYAEFRLKNGVVARIK